MTIEIAMELVAIFVLFIFVIGFIWIMDNREEQHHLEKKPIPIEEEHYADIGADAAPFTGGPREHTLHKDPLDK